MAQEGFKRRLASISSGYRVNHIPFHRWTKCIIPYKFDRDETTVGVDRLLLINLGDIKNEMPKMSV